MEVGGELVQSLDTSTEGLSELIMAERYRYTQKISKFHDLGVVLPEGDCFYDLSKLEISFGRKTILSERNQTSKQYQCVGLFA